MKEYRDHYFLKAKREKYPARSVYKLKELDAKFRLLKPGLKVLDLGAAPRLLVSGRGREGGFQRLGAGLRHPEHGDGFSPAGHLHARRRLCALGRI